MFLDGYKISWSNLQQELYITLHKWNKYLPCARTHTHNGITLPSAPPGFKFPSSWSPFDEFIAVLTASFRFDSVPPSSAVVAAGRLYFCTWAAAVCTFTWRWVFSFSQALASVGFCSVIRVKLDLVLFFTVPFLGDGSLLLQSRPNISEPLLWTSDWVALTGLGTFRLWAVNVLEFIDLLALWDSCGGLMSLFLGPENSLFVFLSSFVKMWRVLCSLDTGLWQIRDASLQAWGVRWFLSVENDEESLIWLLGVSGTERRSGEEGRRFSMTPRMLLLKGESGLNAHASSLMWGSSFAGADRVRGKFVRGEES